MSVISYLLFLGSGEELEDYIIKLISFHHIFTHVIHVKFLPIMHSCVSYVCLNTKG
jgi:hypothetical protein